MSILSIEPNHGIRIGLAGYYRIRTWMGGGEMWEHQNQQVIRTSLGDFLPKAMPEGKESVLFQHFPAGAEVCSLSKAVTTAHPVPRSEMDRLLAAVTALKQKAADPHCDPNSRKLIETFRIPNPAKDPDLYRLYGHGAKQRLIVLWGLEREEGSALAPQEALQRVPVEKAGRAWWPWAALAALLLVALAWWLMQDRSSVAGSHANPIADSGAAAGSGNSSADSAAAPISPGAAPEKSGAAGGPLAATSSTTSGSPESITSAQGTAGTTIGDAPGQPLPPGKGNPSASATALTAPRDTAAETGAAPKPPGSPASSTMAATSGTAVPPPGSKSPPDSPATGQTSSAAATAPGASPVKPGDSPSSVTRKSQTLPDNSSTGGKDQPAMPLTAATDAAPLSAEIVNGRTNAAPIDGKVEMLLSVLARDTAGKAVNVVKVTGWTVDGRAQLDAQGQPIALNALPVQLPEGKHSVSVTGLAADGRSVAGSADVSVDIAVREESTVRLKQLTPPPTPPAPKTSKP